MHAVAAVLVSLALAQADAPPCPGYAEARPPAIASGAEDLARVAELERGAPLRLHGLVRPSARWTVPACDPGTAPARLEAEPPALAVRAVPVRLETFFRSAYAEDRNDGAVWAGRGVSTQLGLGLEARWRFLSAGVAPTAAWQQNRAFDVPAAPTPGYSPWANPFNSDFIDLPLRFGPEAFWTLSPGQSYLRADAFGAAVGVSTENLWFGPGQRNALLLSNTAEGFPHLFVGTSRPVDVYVGELEAELFWGRLRESGWFDGDPSDDRRVLTGLALAFSPRGAPGLSFGLLRVYDRIPPPGGLGLRDYLRPILEPFLKEQVAREGQPDARKENQLLSLTARWAFPQVGFELYGELGRDDHSWDLRDLLQEPWHASATLWGLQKVFSVGPRRLRVAFESARTHIPAVVNPVRPTPIFYANYSVPDGWTNRGQPLGAAIGPQAESQWLALDLLTRGGRIGAYAERVLRNERYFEEAVPRFGGHDVAVSLGVRQVHRLRDVEVDWELARAFRYDAYFGPDRVNWEARVALSWTPGVGAATDRAPRGGGVRPAP